MSWWVPARCPTKTSFAVIKILVDLRNGRGEVDDIDHLGNRRVRSVEQNWPRTTAAPVWCALTPSRNVLNQAESDNLMPHDLINAKPVSAASKEFSAQSIVAVHGLTSPNAVGSHHKAPRVGLGGRFDPRTRWL